MEEKKLQPNQNHSSEATLEFQVIGIGHPIVDVLAEVDEQHIVDHGLPKGAMTLVDSETAEKLYTSLNESVEVCGGSAANTMVGLASFGEKVAFIGKTADDQLGEIFVEDISNSGVYFGVSSKRITREPGTGHCVIAITPDAQRTMATFLGAASTLAVEDINSGLIASSSICYLEGYLWDSSNGFEVIEHSIEVARSYNRKVAISLSDPFCVQRHQKRFFSLLERGLIDIAFCNEDESKMLFPGKEQEEIFDSFSQLCPITCITKGAQGSSIIAGSQLIHIPAITISEVIDTTGAGDLYASGFLFGIGTGKSLQLSGRLAALAAGEVISHVGAHPVASLSELATSEGLI